MNVIILFLVNNKYFILLEMINPKHFDLSYSSSKNSYYCPAKGDSPVVTECKSTHALQTLAL